MNSIDPTAVLDKDVVLGNNIKIGSHAVIKGKVQIDDNCTIMDNATIYGDLVMGCGNIVHPGAVLGNAPQDISYRGEPTKVIIGNNNVFREFVTLNRGTMKANGETIIGNNNLIMAYSHIAHDCIIGDDNILPNSTTLGGHVIIGNHVHTGALTGIHQFITIGDYSFIGFSSRIVKDVPPYVIVEGSPAEPRGINQIGLERCGLSEEDIALLKKAFRLLYTSDSTFAEKIILLKAPPYSENQHTQSLLNFVIASSNGRNGRAQEIVRSSVTV